MTTSCSRVRDGRCTDEAAIPQQADSAGYLAIVPFVAENDHVAHTMSVLVRANRVTIQQEGRV